MRVLIFAGAAFLISMRGSRVKNDFGGLDPRQANKELCEGQNGGRVKKREGQKMGNGRRRILKHFWAFIRGNCQFEPAAGDFLYDLAASKGKTVIFQHFGRL